ncbi:MAG: hypothetical protein IT162_03695 [Bryobacterales bacterium]|nr:hypothetical protein [Bryobacterales bacterium]
MNYFNYFTEIEEHFQRERGTGLFLLSPLDWALIESWKSADVPLEAALRGITIAFEKWRTKKTRTQKVNGLAWCAQVVLDEAARMKDGLTDAPTQAPAEAPFTLEELRTYLTEASRRLNAAGPGMNAVWMGVQNSLADLETHYTQLEPLEQRLTVLEEKMVATARAALSESDLLLGRQELDAQLRPYRSRMSGPQLAMLEKQYLDRWLLEHHRLPRLSLFYVR